MTQQFRADAEELILRLQKQVINPLLDMAYSKLPEGFAQRMLSYAHPSAEDPMGEDDNPDSYAGLPDKIDEMITRFMILRNKLESENANQPKKYRFERQLQVEPVMFTKQISPPRRLSSGANPNSPPIRVASPTGRSSGNTVTSQSKQVTQKSPVKRPSSPRRGSEERVEIVPVSETRPAIQTVQLKPAGSRQSKISPRRVLHTFPEIKKRTQVIVNDALRYKIRTTPQALRNAEKLEVTGELNITTIDGNYQLRAASGADDKLVEMYGFSPALSEKKYFVVFRPVGITTEPIDVIRSSDAVVIDAADVRPFLSSVLST